MNNSAVEDPMVAVRPSERTGTRWAVVLLGLVGVGLVLRLLELTSHSLWFDEGLSLSTALPATFGGFMANLSEMGPGQITQPLYFLILHWWIKIAGAGDASLRLLSVLLGTAAVGVTTIAALQIFGRRHAMWATAFMATSGFAVYYSQEIRPYALLMLLTALLVWAYMRVAVAPRLSAGLIAALTVTTVLSLLGSFIFVFFLTALALADLAITLPRKPGGFKRWFLTWLVPGLAALPVLAVFLAAWPSTTSVSAPPNPLLNLFYVPFGLIVGQTFGPPLDTLRGSDVVQVVLRQWPQLLALAVTGLLLLVQLRRLVINDAMTAPALAAVRAVGLSIVISYAIGVVMVFGLDFNWLPRRAFYLLVPLALVLPVAAMSVERRWLAGIPLAALIALNLISVNTYFFDPTHRRDEYREALAYLDGLTDAPAAAVILEGNLEVLRHYGHPEIMDGVFASKTDDFLGAIGELSGGADALTVLIARPWDFRRHFSARNDRPFLEVMADDWTLADRQSFVAIDVYRFTRLPQN